MEQSDFESGFHSFDELSDDRKHKKIPSPEGSDYSDYAPSSPEERLPNDKHETLETELVTLLPEILNESLHYFKELNKVLYYTNITR